MTEKFPPGLKEEIHERDNWRCQLPYDESGFCGRRKNLEVHHIENRSQGGGHEKKNLITLCSIHHRMLTELNVTPDFSSYDFENGGWRE